LFDPGSPLRVRVLHVGKPTRIDLDWWRARLREAIERRNGLFDEYTTGYRFIHGENDRWPGLVLDRYDVTLVLKLYTVAWLPRLDECVKLIRDELRPSRIVLRLSRNIQSVAQEQLKVSDGQNLFGPPLSEPVTFLESGLRFEADVLRGQKTGFFLDQRENRRLVESLARGRDVLNAFSFSGGFSLYATRGGARSVTDLDISAHALESAARNFALNRCVPQVISCERKAIQDDAFDWLAAKRARRFDLVILDPPSLARRESERGRAIRAYEKLAAGGISALRPGGILVAASCSAHVSEKEFFDAVRGAGRNSRRTFREIQTTGHPPDHPATFPEAHYLKCIYLRL
jgi:23S rRNA (cytosine1962-C5)-methyltransferase